MLKRKGTEGAEIATKLAQANDLATQGKLQSEIARTLGVSVMTLHRWRKAVDPTQPREACRFIGTSIALE
jgi:transposase